MARTNKKACLKLRPLALAGCFAFLGLSPLEAEKAGKLQPPVVAAPQGTLELSPECRYSGTALASLAPLPNTIRAIRERRSVRLLAIGATPVARRARSGGGYDLLTEALLEKAIKGLVIDVIERGVSGELADGAAERLKIEVALTNPDLVLWQVGTNDAMAHIPLSDIEETITSTVRWLKEHRVDVILVGLRYSRRMRQDRHYQSVRKLIDSIAKSQAIMRIGRYDATEIRRRAAAEDHPSINGWLEQAEESYDCLAEYVAKGIATVLFAREP
ncbi:MAG: hypothetical protein KKB37_15350 [Alphaproteobacteria bacterium]|nr:hypothetical protein [Alphaproteobacteria bacterium]